MINNAIEKL